MSGKASGSGSGSRRQYGEIEFQQYDPNEGENRRRRKPLDPSRAYKCENPGCERSFDRPSTLAQVRNVLILEEYFPIWLMIFYVYSICSRIQGNGVESHSF